MAKALPDGFPPAEKSHSLYEGIEYQEFWEDPGWDGRTLSSGIISPTCCRLPGAGSSTSGVVTGGWRPATSTDSTSRSLRRLALAPARRPQPPLGDRAILVAADIARLPFKAASFDCVLTIRVLQHVHDLEGTLEEVRRVIGAETGDWSSRTTTSATRRESPATSRPRGHANPFSLRAHRTRAHLISRHPRGSTRPCATRGSRRRSTKGRP